MDTAFVFLTAKIIFTFKKGNLLIGSENGTFFWREKAIFKIEREING